MSDSEEVSKTRRTEGVLTGGRAARIVEAVLQATAEELSRVGYAALRVEDVAARCGVNKTTIYRRWPSKPELVAAALEGLHLQETPPDTGDIREDLLTMLRSTLALARSPTGRGLLRILQTEGADPEVEKLSRQQRDRQRASRAAVIERAMERGQLPSGQDPGLIAELVFAPVFARIMISRTVSAALAGEIVDTVLAGVRARG